MIEKKLRASLRNITKLFQEFLTEHFQKNFSGGWKTHIYQLKIYQMIAM